MVLRTIIRSKREKGEGNWRRLHNEELHNLYASQNVIKVIKSRIITWTEHKASENLKGRDHAEDLRVDGRIFEWIIRKQRGKVWITFIWLRIGASGGLW
jgi:hypothetical protein